MTKVTTLGQDEPKTKPKKIEFTHHFDYDKEMFIETIGVPSQWENVTKMPFKLKGSDIFACWDTENPDSGNLYLGKFNDGIV